MWQGFSEADAEAGERAVAEGSYPFGGDATADEEPGTRWFSVDGEAMAEGGVPRELREPAAVLPAHGVELRVENVKLDDDEYVVAINDRRCVVWTRHDRNTWFVSTARPFAVVNDLLEAAGAVPRIFLINPGANTGEAWLLDPRIVEAVAKSGLVKDESMPMLATHV